MTLGKSDIELIVNLFKENNGNAREVERILSQEPYFSRNQNYDHETIIKYCRKNRLEIRGRGGPNSLGKKYKRRKH